MKRIALTRRQCGLFLATATAVGCLSASVTAGPLMDQWQNRAREAQAKLGNADLDVCDLAYERGFASPKPIESAGFSTFEVTFQAERREMKVSFIYEGDRLSRFVISALPNQWIATQMANNKTLTVIIPSENCAFDICTNDPFAAGPCLGESLD